MWVRQIAVAALLVFISASCVGADTQECDFGWLCPAGTECNAVHGIYILPEQRIVCQELHEGDTCSFSNVPAGTCYLGV